MAGCRTGDSGRACPRPPCPTAAAWTPRAPSGSPRRPPTRSFACTRAAGSPSASTWGAGPMPACSGLRTGRPCSSWSPMSPTRSSPAPTARPASSPSRLRLRARACPERALQPVVSSGCTIKGQSTEETPPMPSATKPVTDELIEMRGLRFHYRDWPSKRADAPDLLLLHGFTGHARSWDAFAEAMSDRYRVFALDQRGHGETGWAGADSYGNPEMVDDLAAFVAALGLQRFSLLGLSMGGMVAINYAGRRPEQLAALVIVDIGPHIETAGASRIQTGVR